MDVNRQPNRYHYEVQPGEAPRIIYMTFDDHHPQDTIARLIFREPFKFTLGKNGKRNAGIALTQLTLINAPVNVCEQRTNNTLLFGNNLETATRVTLRDGFYDSINAIRQEIAASNVDCSFGYDNLYYTTYSGSGNMYIPLGRAGEPNDEHIGQKFGFTKGEVEVKDGTMYLVVRPETKSNRPGDIYGPTADIRITCDEVVYTAETDKVVATANLGCVPQRAYCSIGLDPEFREIMECHELTSLTLRVRDRTNKPLRFVSGAPSATLKLMHLS
ncbi:LO5 protein [Japanese eel endothelial cells-infecting virus]|uniref:LO5 protein n=1 Tax=Japanese eel endothelial cells-infecting virus TaxID=712037 RepID=UPI00052E4FB5|nr:LO5 protein [Japanese eel endothelial cells-infecting virus]